MDRKIGRANGSVHELTLNRSNSTIISPSFWTIIELLRNPSANSHLHTSITQFHAPQTGKYDIQSISSNIPLLQSVLLETQRLRTATLVARRTAAEFQLDEHWALSKDSIMTFFSQDFSLNTEIWRKARPHSISKPLEEFWPERFLVPQAKSSIRTSSKKTHDTRFSLEGLEWLKFFSEGNNTLLGREYAEAMQIATLSVFLTQFELQLCEEPEVVEACMPKVRDEEGPRAYGVVKPLESVAVRIRKRRVG